MISVSVSHHFERLKCDFKGITTAPQIGAAGEKESWKKIQKIKITEVCQGFNSAWQDGINKGPKSLT